MRPTIAFLLLFLLAPCLFMGQAQRSRPIVVDSIILLKDSISRLQTILVQLEQAKYRLEVDNKKLLKQVKAPSFSAPILTTPKPSFLSPIRPAAIFAAALFALLVICVLIFRKIRKHSPTQEGHTLPPPPFVKQTLTPPIVKSFPTNHNPSTNSFSNVQEVPESNQWYIVGASAIGKSHISAGTPCQDNHFCASIEGGWGIAIVSDGAGSAANSQLGSDLVSKQAFQVFAALLQKYIDRETLPSDREWKNIANQAFRKVYAGLTDLAKKENLELSSLACTAIVVVFSPDGLLSTHIGDGRAGYCNVQGKWQALLTPHKGEEANQTIFLTSPWIDAGELSMSGVPVPETRVIHEKATAFTLLSDGCESHSFESSKMDDRLGRWSDPNLPAEKFFTPLVQQLKKMNADHSSTADANHKWIKFVESGNEGLQNEPDDKTLILGILI